MLLPLDRLLEHRAMPVTARIEQKVSDAMTLMITHDYSQLPVIDAKGELVGMISDDSILRAYYYERAAVSLLDLSIDHCLVRPITMSPNDDLFDALDRLKTVPAIIVVKDNKPYRILTTFDTTDYFRDVSEGMIMVENIEVRFRKYIEHIYPTEEARDAALIRAMGADRRNPSKPAREYTRMTLGDTLQFMMHDEIWPDFQGILEPRELFRSLMDSIRQIRNQLAHFRDELDPVQRAALMNAQQWLNTRPRLKGQEKPGPAVQVNPKDIHIATSDQPFTGLTHFLQTRKSRVVTITLDDIEKLIGDALPKSATEHESWWENDPANPYSAAWLQAGYATGEVDLSHHTITFKQSANALMQLVFYDVLQRVKAARPGLTRATRVFLQNWFRLPAGKSGYAYIWGFTSEGDFIVELYIDVGDGEQNKEAFQKLESQKAEIEQEMGSALRWERLDNRKGSRIRLGRSTNLHAGPEEIEAAKVWALETTLKFADVFQARIQAL